MNPSCYLVHIMYSRGVIQLQWTPYVSRTRGKNQLLQWGPGKVSFYIFFSMAFPNYLLICFNLRYSFMSVCIRHPTILSKFIRPNCLWLLSLFYVYCYSYWWGEEDGAWNARGVCIMPHMNHGMIRMGLVMVTMKCRRQIPSPETIISFMWARLVMTD